MEKVIMERAILEKTITEARSKLARIEDEERYREALPLLGKCFRTRNCYSCPEKDSDYWWVYIRVTKVSKGGGLYAFQFQTDKNGDFFINPNRYQAVRSISECYDKISLNQFKAALSGLESKIKAHAVKAKR